jgi:hypothetical protein
VTFAFFSFKSATWREAFSSTFTPSKLFISVSWFCERKAVEWD